MVCIQVIELPEASDENNGGFLSGFKILLAVTASISIYRVPDLIRDMRREGALVKVVASKEALDLVGKKVFQWASGEEVISDITGRIEHVSEFDGEADSIIFAVVPATHNFIGKAASGVADDAPSLFFSYAAGNGNPTVLSPTMHEAMFYNPIMRKNMDALEQIGISIIPPKLEDGKAKIEDNTVIEDYICRAARGHILIGKVILIIGGGTSEPVDAVRGISNNSTGLTAYWLARTAFRLGAEKVVYVGNCSMELPPYVHQIEATNTSEFEKFTLDSVRIYRPDAVFLPAALSDFKVSKITDGKMDSGSSHSIELKPRGKLVQKLRKSTKAFLVTFKLTESRIRDSDKIENLEKISDVVVINEIGSGQSPFGEGRKRYWIHTGKEHKEMNLTKEELSQSLLEYVASGLEERYIESDGSTE
ncbi:MAG: bifunctional phosphopantothenoylcysteine decarboxylase/phosphopantothenate--cysteine ligase CoaBC [Candidatus Thermoplasmatota archaeon]|nr:bifunctional phosphopantothenoylcysteine decarboxylase/phosphopantothenate--cysteine ligase CoaBC [Candidatus Thermoplasmatota archaeon]